MRILTIKFATSNKTYEYLERNPDKIRINYCEKLKIPEYCLNSTTTYKMLAVVNVRDVDVIPSHVTSFIEPVDNNNIIRIGKVNEIHFNQTSLFVNKSANTYVEPKILPTKSKIKHIDEIFTNEPILTHDEKLEAEVYLHPNKTNQFLFNSLVKTLTRRMYGK